MGGNGYVGNNICIYIYIADNRDLLYSTGNSTQYSVKT